MLPLQGWWPHPPAQLHESLQAILCLGDQSVDASIAQFMQGDAGDIAWLASQGDGRFRDQLRQGQAVIDTCMADHPCAQDRGHGRSIGNHRGHQLKPAPADTLLSPEENAPVSETLAFGHTRRW